MQRIVRTALRKLGTFRRLSWREKCWLIPALLLLGICRAVTLLVPFRHLAPLLGHHLKNAVLSLPVSVTQAQQAHRIGRVIRLAARYTPWQSKCLVQAMVARLFLGRYDIPYVFYFGVAKDQVKQLKAHAWVCAGPVCVTGGNGLRQFAVVSTFSSCGHISSHLTGTPKHAG